MQGTGEEITNPCTDCNGQGNKQASKKISVTIPKGVDDGTRIRLAGKGEAGPKVGLVEIYIYLLTFILMIYLKDQMKTYFLNSQFL